MTSKTFREERQIATKSTITKRVLFREEAACIQEGTIACIAQIE